MLWPLLGWSVLLDCETELRLVMSFFIYFSDFFDSSLSSNGCFWEEKNKRGGIL